MKTEIILVLLGFFALAVMLGDQQSQIYQLKLDNQNIRNILQEQKHKENDDKNTLWVKWYELDNKLK